MPTIKVQAYEHTCSRCGKVWGSKLEFPKRCPGCISPYWNKERVKKDYSEIYELAPGARVVVPWPEGVRPHPAARIIRKLRQKGIEIAATYHGDGAHITRLATSVRPPTTTSTTGSTDGAGSTDDAHDADGAAAE